MSVDLERLVVTEHTLSWEAHKASILDTLLVVRKYLNECKEKGIVDQEYEVAGNGLQTEADTFAQREQEMRLQGEIR